jgi:hypothetical protein
LRRSADAPVGVDLLRDHRRRAGHGGRKDAKPLMRIDELAPVLRADQIIGMEVRSSDDKIWAR